MAHKTATSDIKMSNLSFVICTNNFYIYIYYVDKILKDITSSVKFYSDKDLQHLERTVNQELGEINTWLCANKLFLNIDKTHFVIDIPSLSKKN